MTRNSIVFIIFLHNLIGIISLYLASEFHNKAKYISIESNNNDKQMNPTQRRRKSEFYYILYLIDFISSIFIIFKNTFFLITYVCILIFLFNYLSSSIWEN